jgi:hypothetical protein
MASVLAPRLMAKEPAIGQRSTAVDRVRGVFGDKFNGLGYV